MFSSGSRLSTLDSRLFWFWLCWVRYVSHLHIMVIAWSTDPTRLSFPVVKRAEKFHSDLLSRILRRHEGRQPGPTSQPPSVVLEENEWLAIALVPHIGIAKNTLFSWIKRGWVRVSRTLPGYRGRVICSMDADELDRPRRLQETKHAGSDSPLPRELTTPKRH